MAKPTAIVRVHRPDLTPEERARRMERIEKAAIRVLLAYWRNLDEEKLRKEEPKCTNCNLSTQ